MHDNEKTLLSIKKDHEKHKNIMKEISSTNKNVEETVCNVLLAIRQNEYLQAYYPEQLGFKEMKVVGKHPSKNQ